MIDLNKLIERLDKEIRVSKRADSSMTLIPAQYAEEILDILKKQESKCLTKAELNDLNENQFVWIEERPGYIYHLQIIGICREKTGVSDIQFNTPTSYVERSINRYGKSCRIWTNKPTEEQSHEVKWEC